MTDDDIERIGRGVAALTLPKREWTHAAHFAAALWVLDHGGDMPSLIRAYNEATGVANTDTDGYHETITRASLRAAAHVRAAHATRAQALAAILEGPLARSDWLLQHWSRDRLFSVEARRRWLEPDLAPLPFP